MKQIIKKNQFLGNGAIQVLYPYLSPNPDDTGLYGIGRIDHAYFNNAITIKMHPHVNDEILSYFRTGHAKHIDSQGISENVGGTKLMLMKAGKMFYHEETASLEDGKGFEGLQIFMRPKHKDLSPEVSFYDLPTKFSDNDWRIIASPNADTPLQFSGNNWVLDTRLHQGNVLSLPDLGNDLLYLLYVYQGSVWIDGDKLEKKDSIAIEEENVQIRTDDIAELVLFVTDKTGEYFSDGMFSGNQIRKF